MWIELPNLWIAVINIIGIPATHLLIAWWSTRLPSTWFAPRKSLPTKKKAHPIYEKLFLIRHWKHLLPDAAPWFKGFPKGSLQPTDPSYLRTFILETRRGEFSHWVQTIVITAFIAWNPYPANIIIIVYAFLSNLPCILNLRYTRQRLFALLSKRTR